MCVVQVLSVALAIDFVSYADIAKIKDLFC